MWCSSGDTISYTPQGRAYNRFNPSLGQTMNAALLSIIYGQAIQPPATPPTPLQVRPHNLNGVTLDVGAYAGVISVVIGLLVS